MEYKPNERNQWGAELTFNGDVRGVDAEVIKIYAEFLGINPKSDEVISLIEGGFGIYNEKTLNELINHFGLRCDQAESGEGFSTFKRITNY